MQLGVERFRAGDINKKQEKKPRTRREKSLASVFARDDVQGDSKKLDTV